MYDKSSPPTAEVGRSVPPLKPEYTVPESARILGCSRRVVYDMIHAGRLKARERGRPGSRRPRLLVPRAELEGHTGESIQRLLGITEAAPANRERDREIEALSSRLLDLTARVELLESDNHILRTILLRINPDAYQEVILRLASIHNLKEGA